MAHKYEHVSTGNGFSVKNGSTTTQVIDQTGKFAGTFTNVSVATSAIADNAVTSEKLDISTIQYAAVSVSNSEIKALRATPKTLVSAPGAGKYLELVSAVLFLDYGTNALTESTANLAVKYNNGSGVQVSQTIESTGFIDQTADTATSCLPKIDAIVAKSGCENKALVLHNLGAGEISGNAGNDSTLRVKIAYRVHTTGW